MITYNFVRKTLTAVFLAGIISNAQAMQGLTKVLKCGMAYRGPKAFYLPVIQPEQKTNLATSAGLKKQDLQILANSKTTEKSLIKGSKAIELAIDKSLSQVGFTAFEIQLMKQQEAVRRIELSKKGWSKKNIDDFMIDWLRATIWLKLDLEAAKQNMEIAKLKHEKAIEQVNREQYELNRVERKLAQEVDEFNQLPFYIRYPILYRKIAVGLLGIGLGKLLATLVNIY